MAYKNKLYCTVFLDWHLIFTELIQPISEKHWILKTLLIQWILMTFLILEKDSLIFKSSPDTNTEIEVRRVAWKIGFGRKNIPGTLPCLSCVLTSPLASTPHFPCRCPPWWVLRWGERGAGWWCAALIAKQSNSLLMHLFGLGWEIRTALIC